MTKLRHEVFDRHLSRMEQIMWMPAMTSMRMVEFNGENNHAPPPRWAEHWPAFR